MNKIEYLNSRIYSNNNLPYGGPKLLYKYRPFDKYSFDMLENEYLYLCPAEKEDDETECMTTVDFERLVDLETNNLKRVLAGVSSACIIAAALPLSSVAGMVSAAEYVPGDANLDGEVTIDDVVKIMSHVSSSSS